MAPKKLRSMANLVRGLKIDRAESILANVPNRAALPLIKALKSAMANAENNYQLHKQSLRISQLTIDQSMSLPRFRPRAQGRAFKIQKKFSHINILLEELPTVPKKGRKASVSTKAKSVKATPVAAKKPQSVITKTKMK